MYRPLTWDFAIFQSPPLNGALDLPACQAWLDGVEYSSVLRTSILPYQALLSNGDRVYKGLGASGDIFGPTGVHRLRLRLVLLSGQVLDETFYWRTVE